MFLFELYLVFSKEVKDSNGKAKYQYKMKMMVSLITQTMVTGTEPKLIVFRRAIWALRSMLKVTSVSLLSGRDGPQLRNPK